MGTPSPCCELNYLKWLQIPIFLKGHSVEEARTGFRGGRPDRALSVAIPPSSLLQVGPFVVSVPVIRGSWSHSKESISNAEQP